MKFVDVEMNGKYLGTEIEEKWWRRYTKDKMLARGNGIFTYNKNLIAFQRYLTENPVRIEASKIREFKIGKWHAGQWGVGKEILKVIWENNGQILSSGFTILKHSKNVSELIQELKTKLELT